MSLSVISRQTLIARLVGHAAGTAGALLMTCSLGAIGYD
jgi:hypothetical protein